MVDRADETRSTANAPHNTAAASSPTRPLVLATVSFALSFAAWGLVGGLAPVFTSLYSLTASQTALLVAVPVLLGSLARLPMGMLTDRFGGRAVFTGLLAFSSLAAFVVPLTTSYPALLVAAFLIGMAGSPFAVGAAFVSVDGNDERVARRRRVDRLARSGGQRGRFRVERGPAGVSPPTRTNAQRRGSV